MAQPGLRPFFILTALALSFALSPSLATMNETNETGCVNLEYDHWGGPLMLRPYSDGTLGILVTEDATAEGATLAVVVVPDFCGPSSTEGSFAPLVSSNIALPGTTVISSDPGVPALP